MSARLALTTSLIASSALMLAACASPPPPWDPKIDAYDGAQLFQTYCARCHGDTGKGDGLIALTILEYGAADLTQIASRAGGTFPREEVRRSIAGTPRSRGHRRRDMPVWARHFYDSRSEHPAAERARADALIERLVDHVESLQSDPPKQP